MSVVFNSISQFVEQVGRRRMHKSNPDQLDTMSCVFTGPSIGADGFLPRDLATHPLYPFMLCSGWDVVDQAGLVAELHVNYQGKINAGQKVVSTSTHEGSVSWTTYKGQVSKILTPAISTEIQNFGPGFTGGTFFTAGTIPATYSVAYLSISYVCRYAVSSTRSSYLARKPVAGGGIGPDITVPNQKIYVTGASLSDNHTGLVNAELRFENQKTIENNDLGNGWYLVTETLVPTPYIVSNAFLS